MEGEVHFIITILNIKDKKHPDDPDPTVATITEAGLRYYRSHPDGRVRKALQTYLSHPRRKPIVQVKILAAA